MNIYIPDSICHNSICYKRMLFEKKCIPYSRYFSDESGVRILLLKNNEKAERMQYTGLEKEEKEREICRM